MSEMAGRIEAAFDPSGAIAPDALLGEAAERAQALLQAFQGAAGGLESEQTTAVYGHLETVVSSIGQAVSALRAARDAKDALLEGEVLPGNGIVPAGGMPAGTEVARPRELGYIPPENRGWEDPRLLMSAHELVGRMCNVNFHPYGSLESTGIQQVRDIFMAPKRLAENGVISRDDTGRLIRELRETHGDLPAFSQFSKPEPAMAAFLYETAGEVPADLIMATYVESFMGHAVPKGQRVTMYDFVELLKQRTGLLEPLPSDIAASMDVLKKAGTRVGRLAGPLELRALTEAFEFIEKFHEARREGGRPPRADSDPWNAL